MKRAFLTLPFAIASVSLTASEKPPARDWMPSTPGIEIHATTQWNAEEGTFEVRAAETGAIPVLTDSKPGRPLSPYQVTGEVRYEGVHSGFLEMWNHFPPSAPGAPGQSYFSRTLADSGPLGKLEGTSAWRPFVLPFFPEGASGPPSRLELNVVLPDGGSVWLRNVRLSTSDSTEWADPIAAGRLLGLIGGSAGGAIGLLSGLVGLCLRKATGRTLVTVAIVAMIVVAITGGGAIIWLSAKSHLWWALSIGAVVAIFPVFHALKQWKEACRVFGEREFRRMQAADA